MYKRINTKKIRIGNTFIGGANHVLVQSMCNIKTENYDEVIKQINRCTALGAEAMRVSILDQKDALSVSKIKKEIKIPLIADIHFDADLA
ncbi:MAG TPA: 4-hydroxy-3-methylbut-2-en-1-yl diphosphate synthase, partial [Firmicutes bacterium]|nr:4-hydroxy-3-methylbut-2-en-1-yl diphosphate synthase [Bacillota bacterium]